jgi:hypothetical protein
MRTARTAETLKDMVVIGSLVAVGGWAFIILPLVFY